jgi:pSer/pThr/pTyr-binding forkhead associated (FHA) protein
MTQPTCPNCNAPVIAGSIYCDSCGLDLRTVAATPASTYETRVGIPADAGFAANALPVYQPPIPDQSASPTARLMLVRSNISLDLPADRPELIVGREDSVSGVFPDINLEPFGAQDAGVSRRHLRLHKSGENWVVEDLTSINGTFLNRQRLAAGQLALLKDGDELRLGSLALTFKRGE